MLPLCTVTPIHQISTSLPPPQLLLVLLGLAATVSAVPSPAQYGGNGNNGGSYGNNPPANYDFNWAVNDPPSGNDYGQHESRNGDNTQGSYFVQLPDGRLQRVEYTISGDSGFVAQVTYEGEAQFPKQNGGYGKPQPSYGPPKDSYGPPKDSYGAPSK